MANNISLSEILHKRPVVVPTVYGYVLPDLKDHDGYIKIGYTDRKETETRIREQLHTAAINFKVLFKQSAMRPDGTCFTDKDVHRLLKHKGFLQLNAGADKNEWFRCSVEDALIAIEEVRTETRFEGSRTWNFSMRGEQQQAVEMTKTYFEQAKLDDPARPPKFLWNAKMRFGKTFASYELCKAMGFKKILVLTFKPAVESAWQEDLNHHVDFKGWQFVSNKEAKFDAKKLDEQFDECDKTKPIVVFGSFQDLLGTTAAGGIKAKNEFIHATNWDIIVFDEYHFGAWRENAKNLFEKFDEENDDFDLEKYQKEEAGNAINETFLPITSAHYLYLSGTPFRALNSGEFLEDQVFNWTYSDEQSAKENWDSSRGENPYAALPKMVMLTYKVPDSITANVAINEGYDEFDINEFFRAEIPEKGKVETARFVYEDDVQKWLKMIQGSYMPVDGLKLGAERPPMPFSDTTLLNVLSHTLWFLPNVASCYAMNNLLRQKQNNFFDDYKIIVCAGTKAGIGLDALAPVLNAMGDPLTTKTITLSCGKLTTGVTVRPWAGVFMLRNLKSPETYFQTAFRVQSPWEVMGDNGEKEIIKRECYIFDFALERALHQISDYSCRLKVDDTSPEQKVSEFISFLPVLAFDGASMNRIDAQDILDITYAGTSATLLAKRWQTALLVHVDNDTLKRLQDNRDALDALMRIEGFRSLNAEIQIINRSEKVKKLKKEKGDELTPAEKREMTEEEKQAKSLRKQVQENLLKLAARIPAFMYLTDYREQTTKDVITQIEPELFRKVTGLTVKDFDTLCSIGLFDSEKMNQGIFGFRKYENSSLSYTGIDKHEGEAIGGWDTVLRREEYEALYSKQQATMTDFEGILIPEKYRAATEKDGKAAVGGAAVGGAAEKEKAATSVARVSEDNSAEKELEEMLAKVKVDVTVSHKKFGNGVITWISADNKYLRVKFSAGEKQFVFPDAFIMGFLKVES